jgi:transmembrane sensor
LFIIHSVVLSHLLDEATPEERAALATWRAASPANEREFRWLTRIWKLLGAIGPDLLPPASRLAELSSGTRGAAQTRSSARAPKRWWERNFSARLARWCALAAAAALVVVGTGRGSLRPSGDVVTGRGEVATVRLSDGSAVRLGPESRLRYHPAAGKREVVLEGQAYFSVSSGHPSPFRIRTEAGDVEVVGTRFDLRTRGREMRIVVVEGEVEAGVGEYRVRIQQGQEGLLQEDQPPELQPVENAYAATAWIGSFVAFDSTSLAEIADELEIRMGLRLHIAQEELATRTVTGIFVDQSPETMVKNICLAVEAQCLRNADSTRFALSL